MQHFAVSAACQKRQREELEEPQSSLAEPCLADHVQLGCPENVQLGSAEHKLLFRAVLEEVSGCREASNKLRRTFKTKTPGQAHQLESVNVQVDQAFAKAAALSEGIHPELLTPPVHYRQWQPHSALERLRVTTNKRKATAASKRSLASASGHSTPAMRPHAGGTLQHEIKKLDSSIRPTRASVKTPEQIERNKAFKAEAAEKRTRDKADPPYHPGSDFQPDKLVDRERLSRERERLSQIPQLVPDYTSLWSGTDQFWEHVTEKRLVELDVTSPRMQKHFEITTGGVEGECAVWNVGGNPGFDPGPEYLARGLLPRLVKAIGVMVIHSFFVSDCTVFCFAMW